jgi:MFS-type transporter involved in bile tolerance (Atg22 family)
VQQTALFGVVMNRMGHKRQWHMPCMHAVIGVSSTCMLIWVSTAMWLVLLCLI